MSSFKLALVSLTRRVVAVCFVCLLSIEASGEVVLFYEDGGTSASTIGQSVESYSGFTSGNAIESNNLDPPNASDVQVLTPGSSNQSTGYAGASAGTMFGLLDNSPASPSSDLIIRGIDTTSFIPGTFQLSFGVKLFQTTSTNLLSIYATTNDVDFVVVDFPTLSSTLDWQLYEVTDVNLPSSNSVSLHISKFNPATAPLILVMDDIKLTGVTAVPEPSSLILIALGGTVCVCGRRKRSLAG